jgi:hypothetical protein
MALYSGGRRKRRKARAAEDRVVWPDKAETFMARRYRAPRPVTRRQHERGVLALNAAFHLGSGSGGSHSRVRGRMPQRDWGALHTIRVVRDGCVALQKAGKPLDRYALHTPVDPPSRRRKALGGRNALRKRGAW